VQFQLLEYIQLLFSLLYNIYAICRHFLLANVVGAIVHYIFSFDSPVWTENLQFPGCRQVAAFFAWLDYCDQVSIFNPVYLLLGF
jgi:hypothetical protein